MALNIPVPTVNQSEVRADWLSASYSAIRNESKIYSPRLVLSSHDCTVGVAQLQLDLGPAYSTTSRKRTVFNSLLTVLASTQRFSAILHHRSILSVPPTHSGVAKQSSQSADVATKNSFNITTEFLSFRPIVLPSSHSAIPKHRYIQAGRAIICALPPWSKSTVHFSILLRTFRLSRQASAADIPNKTFTQQLIRCFSLHSLRPRLFPLDSRQLCLCELLRSTATWISRSLRDLHRLASG